jgi:dipicolinate synthase subunit A
MLSFTILGGDLRYKILSDMLKKQGFSTKIYRNSFATCNCKSLDEALENANIVIAPIPVTKSNNTIFFDYKKSEMQTEALGEITVKHLFSEMHRHNIHTFLGGVITKELKETASDYAINVYDFFEQEYVAVLNAIPTAEGAVKTAIEESERTIFSSKALITGYGRCAKALCSVLKAMGAECYATYRSEKDHALIKAASIIPINFYDIKNNVSDKDYIFNTIPAMVLSKEVLKNVNKNAVIVDIAQAPGGVDFSFARNINLHAFYCPGLPGRVAPFTAAEILKEAILNIVLSQPQ